MNYPLALKNGTVLAKDYRIERVLGAGGSGITYVAKELSLHRDIAIKEYFPSDFAIRGGETDVCAKTKSDEEDYSWGLDRFIEEAQILAKFDHSNIVRVFRYFQTHNTAYMVLKLEEGRSFKTWLAELGRQPSQSELEVILRPLLDALTVIHKVDFLHRDIAPDNIIIRQNGSPVLIDFGSARQVISSRPKTVSALIKPGYSPFEQYAATGKDQGPWTDIYSLAATLYHAVTGKRPIDSPTRMVGDELIPAEKAALSGYRKEFLKAIDNALKLRVKNRPQSIEEWSEQLFAAPASKVIKKKSKPKQAKPAEKAETMLEEKFEDELKSGSQAKNEIAEMGKRVEVSDVKNISAPLLKRPLLQRIKRNIRRSVLQFIAENARSQPVAVIHHQGGLINRLGHLGSSEESRRSLEEQIQAKQAATLESIKNQKKKDKKSGEEPVGSGEGFLKKILAKKTVQEKSDKKKKAEPVPNKSFEPTEITQKADQSNMVSKDADSVIQKLVTVRLKRSEIKVDPSPTTQARERLRKGSKDHKKRGVSKFTIALRVMQMIMIIAIVLPLVYILNLEGEQAGNRLAANGDANLIRIIKGHRDVVTSLVFSGDGDFLLSGGRDNVIRIWDPYSGEQIRTLSAHRTDVTGLDVVNRYIISSDADGELILWDLESGKPLKNFKGHGSEVSGVVFAGKGNRIISGAQDNRLKIWNMGNTRREQWSIRPHRTSVRAIAYSQKRRLIASVGAKGRLKVWNASSGRLVRIYPNRNNSIGTVAFSPSGNRLATGGEGQVKIWSSRSKRLYRSIDAHKGKVTSIAFSPNGRWLASAGEDNQIRVWNWRTGVLARTFSGHTAKINTLMFAPDSRRIASAGEDRTVRLWKAPVRIDR